MLSAKADSILMIPGNSEIRPPLKRSGLLTRLNKKSDYELEKNIMAYTRDFLKWIKRGMLAELRLSSIIHSSASDIYGNNQSDKSDRLAAD